MRRGGFRVLLVLVSGLALGSCSYGYDVLAVAIDGRLAFVIDPASSYKPDCISSIHISVDKGGPIARPAAGDDQALVQNGGAYWWKSFDVTSCENRFPIFYAQPLRGPAIYDDDVASGVEPKPLRIGVVYEISTSGDGAYGHGWFRITKAGRIENLRGDPTPAIRNEQGYDVTDYANMESPANEGTYYPSTQRGPRRGP